MNESLLLIMKIVFWFSLSAVAYAYLVYPGLIFIASRLFGRKPNPPAFDAESAPSVSLIISALNEESVVAERIENFLALDYPEHKLKLVIASDGSTDRTNAIVRSYEQRFPERVKLLDYSQRRGKSTVLNDTVPDADGEIVVFSDANTFFERRAVQNLVRWFADPAIGAVCGKLKLVTPHRGTNVDGLYWRYETFLKLCEARLGALLGTNGAIYAMRRSDYLPIPSDTIIDDFMIPLQMKIHTGKRIVYDADAVANEETPADHRAEFRRRTRIGAGGFQSLVRLWRLLLPQHGWSSFTFWSHKLMRWCCPFFLAAMLVANALLVREPLYAALFAGQLAFYAVALVSHYLPGTNVPMRALRLTSMFSSMNLALAIGFWNWASGMQRGTWQRTERTIAPQAAARRTASPARRIRPARKKVKGPK
jgi:cellulose synthase/poly-beta-1,6-N-acetylglucosamine synthase-like glycosyltransferase